MFRNNELAACRAFNRLLIIRTQGMEEMHQADRQFDGGEWSDEAFHTAWDILAADTIKYVAERFDMLDTRLLDCVERKDHYEMEQFYSAMDRASGENPHNEFCHEYWDRGLNCPHISQQARDSMLASIQHGDDIDPGWGQFD